MQLVYSFFCSYLLINFGLKFVHASKTIKENQKQVFDIVLRYA